MDFAHLPPRLVTAEVLEIARFGRGELRSRVKRGTFPKPIDRCGKGDIYRKADVLKALGLAEETPEENPFMAALKNEIEPANIRRRPRP